MTPSRISKPCTPSLPRRPARVTQTEIERAIRALRAALPAGVPAVIELRADGTIAIAPGQSLEPKKPVETKPALVFG